MHLTTGENTYFCVFRLYECGRMNVYTSDALATTRTTLHFSMTLAVCVTWDEVDFAQVRTLLLHEQLNDHPFRAFKSARICKSSTPKINTAFSVG